jgi:hypothetical protein
MSISTMNACNLCSASATTSSSHLSLTQWQREASGLFWIPPYRSPASTTNFFFSKSRYQTTPHSPTLKDKWSASTYNKGSTHLRCKLLQMCQSYRHKQVLQRADWAGFLITSNEAFRQRVYRTDSRLPLTIFSSQHKTIAQDLILTQTKSHLTLCRTRFLLTRWSMSLSGFQMKNVILLPW